MFLLLRTEALSKGPSADNPQQPLLQSLQAAIEACVNKQLKLSKQHTEHPGACGCRQDFCEVRDAAALRTGRLLSQRCQQFGLCGNSRLDEAANKPLTK